MLRWVSGVSLCSLVLFLTGCGDGGPVRPATVDVSGTVNLDGKPMADGEISLMVSEQPDMRHPVKDGKFSGKAYVGDNQVRIYSYVKGEPVMMDGKPFGEPVKKNIVDSKFNDSSTTVEKISASGSSTLKYEVESAK